MTSTHEGSGNSVATLTRADARRAKTDWIEQVAAEQGEGCRDWPWALNNKGYAVVRWHGQISKVGHVVLELSGRPRLTGAMQLHTCDRRQCAAPWHLRWGTALENATDCVARGREARAPGIANGNAKLTDSDVLAIRATTGQTNRAMAETYGVHKTVIGKIRRGVIWRYLPLPEGTE